MKVVKCKNGHFFDSDTYSVCPTCGAEMLNAGAAEKKTVRGTLWSKLTNSKEKKTEPSTASVAEPLVIPEAKEKPDQAEAFPQNVNEENEEDVTVLDPVLGLSEQEDEEDLTVVDTTAGSVSYWEQTQTVYDPLPETDPETELISVNGQVGDRIQAREIRIESMETEENSSEEKRNTLLEDIRKVSANEDGKTMGFFDMRMKASNENRPAVKEPDPQSIVPAQKKQVKLPVGWLICTKGPHFGEEYQLHAGNNSIGRFKENDVALEMDGAVSRLKHAILTYEPRKRVFYLRPGDESGLTYLNNEFLMETTELKNRDEISVGDSSFMFVPLCDESFSWESFLN